MRKYTLSLVLFLGFAAAAQTEDFEKRCGQLGASCVCDEPLNTNTYTPSVAVTGAFNPADSRTHECTQFGGMPGLTIYEGRSSVIGRNDAVMMNALPAGNSIGYALGTPQPLTNLSVYSYTPGTVQPLMCVRFYVYHSADYGFGDGGNDPVLDAQDYTVNRTGACVPNEAADTTCHVTNSKLFEMNGWQSNNYAMLWQNSVGQLGSYNYLSFGPASNAPGYDCCGGGQPATAAMLQSNPHKTQWRGKWWRVEVCRAGNAAVSPVTRLQVRMKNITDNTPETLVNDATALGTQLNPDLSKPPLPLTTHDESNTLGINGYRECNGSGVCNGEPGGWRAFSHFMVAGWNSDLGQRIGCSVEVEGPSNCDPTTGLAPAQAGIAVPAKPVGLTLF